MPKKESSPESSGKTSKRDIVSRERVIHSLKQITEKAQLEVGKRYNEMHINEKGEHNLTSTIEILALDMPEKDWVRVKISQTADFSYEKAISLRDKNIVPYKDGNWNAVNYLIPA